MALLLNPRVLSRKMTTVTLSLCMNRSLNSLLCRRIITKSLYSQSLALHKKFDLRPHLCKSPILIQNTFGPLGIFKIVPSRNICSLSKQESVRNVSEGATKSRWQVCQRMLSSGPGDTSSKKRTTTVIYFCAVGIFMVGATYAGVPLYRIFCQATGLGGQAVKGHDINKVETMEPVSETVIKVRFNADVASSMQWNFKPQQSEVKVLPGETALAFYTATNPTDKPIIGISTYNIVPFEAGQYFNKIQCFCFEEQRLNPHEQVDMPVFFFIDPEFTMDPKCAKTETITLSYTFFEAKEGLELPYPGYATGMYAKSAS